MDIPQLAFIYGLHPLREVLKAKKRPLKKVYVAKPTPKHVQEILKKLPPHVPIVYTEKKHLEELVESKEHQGIVAATAAFPYRKQFFNPDKTPLIVLLDSVQDPRNTGALLRSAYCTGITGALLCTSKSAPLSPSAFKASAGLAEHLDLILTPSPQHAVSLAEQAGYNLYIAALHGKALTQTDFKAPACIVIGNEETGVTQSLLNRGTKITIEQKDPDSSYNASVAGGIIMFYASQKLKLL